MCIWYLWQLANETWDLNQLPSTFLLLTILIPNIRSQTQTSMNNNIFVEAVTNLKIKMACRVFNFSPVLCDTQGNWCTDKVKNDTASRNFRVPMKLWHFILVRIRLISGASLSDWYRKWICVNGILKCSCSVVMGMVACLASCFFCLIWQFERTYNSFRYLHLEIWRFSCWRQTDKPALPLARMRAG